WSQTSVCPPTNHGMDPSGCWARATESTVAETSAAVSTPQISGSCTRLLRPMRVHDETLADQRVKRAVGGACDPRPPHDVPHQQPVIAAPDASISVDTGQALQ